MKDAYWSRFMTTGKVTDYLEYKEEKEEDCKESSGGKAEAEDGSSAQRGGAGVTCSGKETSGTDRFDRDGTLYRAGRGI